MVVAADGAHSLVRAAAGIDASVEDYAQVALVANVEAERPHEGTAFERFTTLRSARAAAPARRQLHRRVDGGARARDASACRCRRGVS